MGLKRKQDWATRLEKAIRSHDRKKFRYGWHDCCISPLNCVKAMTGVDVIKTLGVAYSNEEEAEKVITSKRGMLNMVQEFAESLGVKEHTSPLKAKRGDVGLVRLEDSRLALGIIDLTGGRILVAAPKGWKAYNLSSIVKVWDVN